MGIFDSILRILGFNIINYNGVNEIYKSGYDHRGNKVGKILSEKYYRKNGVYHGKYLKYNNYGKEIWVEREINYSNGLKEGLSRYYWKKYIAAEGNFSNDKPTGIIKTYFRYEDELKDLKLHPFIKEYADLNKGIFKVFSLNGKLLEESEIEDVVFSEGSTSSHDGCYGGLYPKRNGLCHKWFENGKIKEKGFWGKNNTDNITRLCHRKGEHIQYYENGKVFKIGKWEHKQPTGVHKFYYPSGKIEFEVEFAKPIESSSDRAYMYTNKEKPVNERWYNEDGSLMSVNEIIAKGGSPNPRGLFEKSYTVINGVKFRRLGVVKFYESFYRLEYQIRAKHFPLNDEEEEDKEWLKSNDDIVVGDINKLLGI